MGTDEGTIRLAGGLNSNEGRVEVFFRGHWGTVCDSAWDLLDATVVCRQLGYYNAELAVVAQFGTGSGPNWMNNVQCTGYEANLTQCRYSSGYGSCRTQAGVICSSKLINMHIPFYFRMNAQY